MILTLLYTVTLRSLFSDIDIYLADLLIRTSCLVNPCEDHLYHTLKLTITTL